MGTLYIVATPIGNLKDITLRALEVLRGASLILAEDTRVTRKLLAHYEIHKTLKRFDEYAKQSSYEDIKNRLERGEKIAFVSDAGTPVIADPGSKLVRYLRSDFKDFPIVAIPGPSAIVTALSIAGVSADQFTFLGYPPHKKGRETFFKNLVEIKNRPIVIYEAPHRIKKALTQLETALGSEGEIVIGRELTKLHEEIFKGSLRMAQEYFKGEREKGEFVLIIP